MRFLEQCPVGFAHVNHYLRLGVGLIFLLAELVTEGEFVLGDGTQPSVTAPITGFLFLTHGQPAFV